MGNVSKTSMWLWFGISSRYLCVYFQEIRKTQHLLIRSAICHTVRRLHSAPRSLRCMCKWVVLEITKHRLGRLFGVHLAPIVITYSEPWSFLNLELRYPERLVFERNSSRTLLLRALSSTHTIDKWLSTIHICELHNGVESRAGCRIFTTFKSVKTIWSEKFVSVRLVLVDIMHVGPLMLMRFYQFRYSIGGTVCGQIFRLRGIPFLPNRR